MELKQRVRTIYQMPICSSREECARPTYCEYPKCYVPAGWVNPFPPTRDGRAHLKRKGPPPEPNVMKLSR
jgi:hypothetical protein